MKDSFDRDFQSFKPVYFLYISSHKLSHCLLETVMKIYVYFRLFQMFHQMLKICQGAHLSLSRVKPHPGRRTKTKALVN